MAKSPFDGVLRYLRRVTALREGGDCTDIYLLQRFAVYRDEVAFEGLLQRHLSMVWNVCRRVLGNRQDAEDACQATFLVLLRRAGSLRGRDSLGNWLYTVAYRIALRAHAEATRRRKWESQLAQAPLDYSDTGADKSDMRSVLDAELSQLPEKYRAPLIYCYLEGKSYEQAARLLGWTVGTLSGRLARGRELLKQRLIRRGLTLSGATLAPTLAQSGLAAAPPLGLLTSTVKMANVFLLGATTGEVSGAVALLVKGTLQTMFLAKAKVAGMIVCVAVLAAGAGVLGRQNTPIQQLEQKAVQPKAEPPIQAEINAQKPLVDRFGDPLPPGAVARLGTLRWRTAGEVEAIAFTPNDKSVAVHTRQEKKLTFFDSDTGKVTKTIDLADISDVRRLAISPDGMRAAPYVSSVAGRGRSHVPYVLLLDLTGEREAQKFMLKDPEWLGWTADERLLAVTFDNETVVLRELESGRHRHFKPSAPPNTHGGVAYSADRGLLAVSDQEGIIHVWDAATGAEQVALKPDGNSVRDLAISADGAALASVVLDAKDKETVQLWNLATGKAAHVIAKGQRYVTTVLFTPDGKKLATRSWREVRFWNVADGLECGRTKGIDSFEECLAFSSDGKSLATTENFGGVVHLWDVATGNLKSEAGGQTAPPGCLAYAPDGQRLASGGMDGTILIWDLKTNIALSRIHKGDWLRSCTFSPDGLSIISCWGGSNIYFSDAASGRDLHSCKLNDPGAPGAKQSTWALHLSDDRKTLTAISESDKVLLTGWDVAGKEQLFRRSREASEFGFCISPDGKVLATVENGTHPEIPVKPLAGAGPLVLEDVVTGERLLTLPPIQRQAWVAGFSPDGRLLVTSVSGGNGPNVSLRLLELASGTEVRRFPTLSNARIDFTRDGRYLAYGAPYTPIVVWDLRNGREVQKISGFDGTLRSLAFSPDGNRLASGLSDTTTLVWDVTQLARRDRRATLDAQDVAEAWTDLAGDAAKAFVARGKLAEIPALALPILKDHLKAALPVDLSRLNRLLAELGNDSFAIRQKAQKELEEVGELAKWAYQRTLAANPPLELRQRVEGLLQKLRGPITRPETLQALRAVAVLEDIGTAEARQLLETLASGEPEARLTQDARAALGRLGRRPALTNP